MFALQVVFCFFFIKNISQICTINQIRINNNLKYIVVHLLYSYKGK